ncbi:heterokaryon incompatibility protein-domain-containing protein [Plectosphaerella cucumerina]|uniref:Heterokaryon incompatibility protein-domain-containing protein n=1 Tax=Plectosphaerella cucumerina TaxID=40658 RepID=A0A8K0X2Y1_9PEZI|nr:heterokaryon incompatibility protein-domain-containing protein [Plectosphaerella cucumerina]
MRLLHTRTYQLETFLGTDIPPYAILSHTWGQDEFVFEDLKVPIADQLDNPKRGLRKVLQSCALAIKDGLDYVWVDTCCIDKSSSAELSEAINSMFAWYRDSSNCYVWLEDVTLGEGAQGRLGDFDASNWFRRGWTLQELIAPHGVAFYDSKWNLIDDRYSLAGRISKLTHIKQEILQRRHKGCEEEKNVLLRIFNEDPRCSSCGGKDNLRFYLWKTPTAARMGWASRRRTCRAEDEAYSLLGLFDVNMPLLYGEGRDKAFRRLIHEMLQHNQADSSILLWQTSPLDSYTNLCLPMDLGPRYFEGGVSSLHLNSMWPKPDLVVNPRGLEVSVWLAPSSAISAAKGAYGSQQIIVSWLFSRRAQGATDPRPWAFSSCLCTRCP